MGYWSNLFSAFRGEKMSPDEWWAEFGPSAASSGGMAVTQITAMQVATVLACVAILAEDVAKLPVHVYKRQRDGGKKIVAKHPVELLLQRPNSFQSRLEFIEQLMAFLLLRGNGYAAIIRDGRGQPTALIPCNPDRVWIYEAQDGSVFYEVARRGPHDMAMLRSLPSRIHSDDMFHLRWLSMDNSLWGASRIQLAKEPIGLALSQQELAGRLSANNTNLGGVLQTDKKLTPEAAGRLKADWMKMKAGVRNAGAIAVLEQGLKWQALGMTAQDAEFIASRNYQVPEIARLFRMPVHKLGVPGGNGLALEQLDQDYVNNTVSPYLERWEGKIDQSFNLSGEGLFVEFDVSKFLRAAIQTRYTAYRTGIVGMFLTPNEARRAEGLPDVEGGDTLYQPTNVAPIGFEPSGSETGPGSDVTGDAAPGGAGDGAAPAADETDESSSS